MVALAVKVNSPNRGLSRHVAVADRPAGERLELRAGERDRPDKDRTELAAGKAASGLDAIIAGEHGLEALDRERTVLAGEREIDRADQVAAKSGLLDGKTQRAVAELGRLAEHLVGEHVKHRGRGGPLLGARHREQRIEIDKARGKLGLGHACARRNRARRLPLKICGWPLAWMVRSKSGSSARSGVAVIGPFNS